MKITEQEFEEKIKTARSAIEEHSPELLTETIVKRLLHIGEFLKVSVTSDKEHLLYDGIALLGYLYNDITGEDLFK